MAHNRSNHIRIKHRRRHRRLKVRKIKRVLARTQDDAGRQKLIDRLKRVAPNVQI